MSQVGERDDAPEVEAIESDEIEQQGADGASADEDGDDGVDEESGEGDDDLPEGDNEPEGAGEQRPEGVAAKPRSAATIAVQEAKRAAKAAREEAESTRRELAELRAAQQGRQTAEQQRLEAERISLMPPEEKYEYLLKAQETRFEARFGALQFQQGDSGDRVAFQSLCARNSDQGKALSSVSDEVERRLTELRRNGGNTSREVLAKYILGERAYERAGRVKAKQEKKGAANIQRQQGKPSGGRSDVQGGQRKGGDDRAARAARLADQQI